MRENIRHVSNMQEYQIDRFRLALSLTKTPVDDGARCLTRCGATRIAKGADPPCRVGDKVEVLIEPRPWILDGPMVDVVLEVWKPSTEDTMVAATRAARANTV